MTVWPSLLTLERCTKTVTRNRQSVILTRETHSLDQALNNRHTFLVSSSLSTFESPCYNWT